MSDPHVFPAPEITVTWSKRRCIHSAQCVAGLQRVFEPGRKPWITPEDAPAGTIARVIERCPTGALHHQRHDGGAAETPDAEASVRPSRNGPLHLRGDLRVATGAGAVLEDARVALCRCGHSRNRPFCDGSHHAAGFRDPGDVFEGRIGPATAPGPLHVTARENGPLRLAGTFAIVSADGRVKLMAGEVALCRCGHSRNKPFCDTSHKTAGFEAPALTIEDAAGA